MGIVPIWGFQMLIALALSIYYKLNKVLVIIAANISLPPLIPFIIYLSFRTGALWMGKYAETISFDKELTVAVFFEKLIRWNSIIQYFAGGITLAVAAGLLFGLSTYWILKFKSRLKT